MRIFLLGVPGSGKDTIRNLLTEKLKDQYPNLYSVDVGTILRDRSKQDQEIKSDQIAGAIVQSNKVLDIFEEILSCEHFIVSGSPRRKEEAEWITDHSSWKANPGELV